jgi:hypothetical protein
MNAKNTSKSAQEPGKQGGARASHQVFRQSYISNGKVVASQ